MIPGAVPMSEIRVALLHCEVANSGFLKIDNIGSGVGIVIFDKVRHIGAGLHFLAHHSGDNKPHNPFMYANTAIPQALVDIKEKGGSAPFSVALAGGAAMLKMQEAQNPGKQLIEAAKEALNKVGLQVTLEETGGTNIRCIVLDIDAGKIKIT